jgi:type 2 lantibiotic biosynthesis protein LanM
MSTESITPRREAIGAHWYRAYYLSERVEAARRLGRALEGHPASSDVASKRLARWQAQPPFGTTSLFANRLVAEGITEAQLVTILGEPPESLQARMPGPEWALRIERAFSEETTSESVSWPPEFQTPQTRGFLDSIQPLIDAALAELKGRIGRLVSSHAEVPFERAAAHYLLVPHLPQRLFGRLARTLVLELNVARLQEKLKGETAEERFSSFLAMIRSRANMQALLEEYPVLGRELVRCLDQWVETSVEFLTRLVSDWRRIRQSFCPGDDPGLLAEVKGDAGDRHRQGRTVFLLRFASGFRLVYKPKSLAADVHFRELLDWIALRAGATTPGNGRPATALRLRIPRVMDRGEYGWVEFVESRGCRSAEEVSRFYRRQGAYLALFYALAAIDFHYENLIAHGEDPIPIDLEALFHPLGLEADATSADYLATAMLYNSVFGVGLLPGRMWSNRESEGVDISGLGALPGQLFPFASPGWEAEGTDEMRMVRKRYPMPEAQNRPTIDGKAVDTFAHADDLIAGFHDMYRLLEAHRGVLTATDGPLARFERDEVRVVVRATRTYAELLRESFHPDVLRDALDRDRLFDRLWNGADQSPYLARLIGAERADLLQGDVPMFTARPSARDLWTSTGEGIPDVLKESGMDRTCQRLDAMGDADLARQLWFIRASLATLAPVQRKSLEPAYQLPEPPARALPGEFLAEARKVGDRLAELAVRGQDDVSWVGLSALHERAWSLVPLGTDFYDGLPGVAFFLAYLGAVSGEDRYAELARAALNTLRKGLGLRPEGVAGIGAFAGWGGLIYTWTHLGSLWQDAALFAEAEGFVQRVADNVAKDDGLDIIDGAAGAALALLALDACRPSNQARAAALRCGERLLARAQPVGAGVGWMTIAPSKVPLAGMAHGAAGISLGLFRLAARTGDARFHEMARKGIAYERGLFSVEKGKWPDFRDFEDRPAGEGRFEYMTAWCHGAAGIGLARLGCLGDVDNVTTRGEIEIALRVTRADGFGWNHTLCHGDLGNLALLTQAGRILDDSYWQNEAAHVATGLLESIRRHRWICANAVNVESPGLMTGLTGIGYGLLSLAAPERVPCILLLEAPVECS